MNFCLLTPQASPCHVIILSPYSFFFFFNGVFSFLINICATFFCSQYLPCSQYLYHYYSFFFFFKINYFHNFISHSHMSGQIFLYLTLQFFPPSIILFIHIRLERFENNMILNIKKYQTITFIVIYSCTCTTKILTISSHKKSRLDVNKRWKIHNPYFFHIMF